MELVWWAFAVVAASRTLLATSSTSTRKKSIADSSGFFQVHNGSKFKKCLEKMLIKILIFLGGFSKIRSVVESHYGYSSYPHT